LTESPVHPIRLLATDLDGTLLGGEENLHSVAEFRDLLLRARTQWGTQWAIVTGRSLLAVRAIVFEFMCMGLHPNFAVTEDARIHHHSRPGQLVPFRWWNFRVHQRRRRMVRRWRPQVTAWHRQIVEQFPASVDLSCPEVHFWMNMADLESAETAERLLREWVAPHREFFVFRWDTQICLMPTAGSKGEAVARLSRHLHLTPVDVLAIGDGPNDMSMLDGNAATRVACVRNATPEVRRAVTTADGFVAAADAMAGVVDILRHHLNGTRPE